MFIGLYGSSRNMLFKKHGNSGKPLEIPEPKIKENENVKQSVTDVAETLTPQISGEGVKDPVNKKLNDKMKMLKLSQPNKLNKFINFTF